MLLVRLDKFLKDANIGTRSEVKKLIAKGFVKVNGECIKDASIKIGEKDSVYVNEELIKNNGYTYLLINKPSGYVCANRDNLHKTIFELLDEKYDKLSLSCVGRLDLDTEGLLLITDDGEFNHKITSPKKSIGKTYYVRLEKELSEKDIDILQDGVLLINENYKTKMSKVEKISSKECYITISEGKFHQIKRMFISVDNKVLYLKRVAIGSLYLPKDLSVGEYIRISKKNLEAEIYK